MSNAAGKQLAKLGAKGVELIAKGIDRIPKDWTRDWRLGWAAQTIRQVTDPAAESALRALLQHREATIRDAAQAALDNLEKHS
jgi:hypothetical protein